MSSRFRPEIARFNFLSPEYPLSLRDLRDPPACISMQGATDFDRQPILGVVGSRDSSPLAEAWMRRVLAPIAPLIVIASGGARGIDLAAHRIALHAKSPTAVVLPSGLMRPYPIHWEKKREEIIACGGCLVTEYNDHQEMKRWHFEQRNRLIAALSDVVLIVEARRRSGTAITARHAVDMHRPIAAVPWFAGDARGELCNDLIATGAHLIRESEELLELLRNATLSRYTRMVNPTRDAKEKNKQS